jgi:hypothetical protein
VNWKRLSRKDGETVGERGMRFAADERRCTQIRKIRKIIYTTNAVESLYEPSEGDQEPWIFPCPGRRHQTHLSGHSKRVQKVDFVQGWREALRQFTIRWPERIEQSRAFSDLNGARIASPHGPILRQILCNLINRFKSSTNIVYTKS